MVRLEQPIEYLKDQTLRTQTTAQKKQSTKLLKRAQEILEDDKAVDLTVIDLEDKTPMAEYLIIVTGTSHRHVSAMAHRLISKLKDEGYGRAQVEGLAQGDWVLVDAGGVIIHIFRPEVRDFYNLEKMWTVDIDEAMNQDS